MINKYNKTIRHTCLPQATEDAKKLNKCIESYENKLDQQVNQVVSHVPPVYSDDELFI